MLKKELAVKIKSVQNQLSELSDIINQYDHQDNDVVDFSIYNDGVLTDRVETLMQTIDDLVKRTGIKSNYTIGRHK
ncbi:MAG: hypothetical protein VB046_08160 [Paludibacter sp.]|nr:hypothetical protein [Paludibacter sp.]